MVLWLCVADPHSLCLVSSLLTSPRLPTVFYQCSGFNRDLSRWDVTSVTNMHGGAVTSLPLLVRCLCLTRSSRAVFNGASSFNSDLSSWDVSSVTSMTSSASLRPAALWPAKRFALRFD